MDRPKEIPSDDMELISFLRKGCGSAMGRLAQVNCYHELCGMAADRISILLGKLQSMQEQNTKLQERLEHIREYWNQDQNETAMADALWHIIDVCDEVISKHAEIAG